MTWDRNETRAAKARLTMLAGVATGPLTLVGSGLGALALIAVSAQLLWQPVSARHQAHEAALRSESPAPRIWLSSLASPEAVPFAAPDYAAEGVLPRRPPQPAQPRPAPAAEAPVAVAPAPDVAVTPTPSAPAVALHEASPGAVPPPRPEALTAALPAPAGPGGDAPATAPDPMQLAALQAPTRSLRPRARPALAAPAPDAVAAAAEAPAADQPPGLLASIGAAATGLLRSRTPQPRPEAVTRLASLDTSRPAPEAAAPQAQPAAPAVIEIPALSRTVTGGGANCGSDLARAIPRRSRGAADGSAVIGRLTGSGGRERDEAIVSEVLAGNVPYFLRNLVPVTFTGNGATITICVAPDYLAVGSDRDFVRVPLGLPAAMRVAERFDMVLPTTRMVDAIYQQASVHLTPAPMDPTSAMVTTNYFLRHNATVQGQLRQAGAHLGQLVSGHKKDLVLTNRLQSNPGQVAIYGWHQRNGHAIQPLSTVHQAQYADYSHGIRLVSRRAYVNGRPVDLRDLLADSRLASVVSSEGTIHNRQLLALAN